MSTSTNMATIWSCEITRNKLNTNRSREPLLPWYCCPLQGARYPVFHWTSDPWRWGHYLVSKRFVTNALWWSTTSLLYHLGSLGTRINMTKATVKIAVCRFYVFMFVCVCVCMYVCVYTYIYICMCVCVCIYIYIYYVYTLCACIEL
jgi:hypothetical protein